MVRLGCDAFLTELTKLMSRCNATSQGSVQLSFKRCHTSNTHSTAQHGTGDGMRYTFTGSAALRRTDFDSSCFLRNVCVDRSADAPNLEAAERAANPRRSSSSSRSDKQQSRSTRDSKGHTVNRASKKASSHIAAATAHSNNTTVNSINSESAVSSTSAQSSSTSSSSPSPASSSPELSLSDEPALLLHARLGDVKLSTVVTSQQSAKLHRQLTSVITAKASDGLASGGRGGAGEAEAERRKKERAKQAAAARKRARDDRAAAVAQGTASSGQVKRYKQESKRREGNRKAAHSHTAGTNSGTGDVEMKEVK